MKVNDIEVCEFLYLPTTRCNCRCKHCAPQVYTGKTFEMSSKELIQKYEKSEFLRGNTVSVAGGEPFLKADLAEFITYLDHKKIPTVISTNGWFTDRIENLIEKLEDNKTVRFAISIDGPAQMHDAIRRCPGIYEKAVQSAILLHNRGFCVQINMVVQKDNLDYLDEFDAFFKKEGIPVIYIPIVFVGEEEFNFTIEDIKKIFKYVDYPRGRKYLLSRGKWLIHNCHAGRNSWMLDCNGDVYACWGGYYKDNAKEYRIGNLHENEFDEIFMSEEKQKVCEDVVDYCTGCLLPRDIERETDVFGYSTKLNYDEVELLADELDSISTVDDFSVERSEWYDVEVVNQQSFHWMKKQNVTLYLNITKDAEGIIKLHYFNGYAAPLQEEELQLTIKIQGEEIATVSCNLGENTAEISSDKLKGMKGLVQVDIATNKMWRPKDINTASADERELGVGIFSVEMQ